MFPISEKVEFIFIVNINVCIISWNILLRLFIVSFMSRKSSTSLFMKE